MAKTLASLTDGRVVPWFSEEGPAPAGFVFVPDALLAKYKSGEITDGMTLARLSLADGSEVGVAPANTATPPPPPPKKAAKEPEKGEPSFPSVTHFPKSGSTRA